MVTPEVETKTLTYDARKGATLTDYGTDYEKKIIAYLAIKCCQEQFENFWMANNAGGLEAFDDVVLYTKTKHYEKRLTVVQLKHREGKKKQFTIDDCGKKIVTDKKKGITYENMNVQTYEKSYHVIRNMMTTQQKTKHTTTKELFETTGVKFKNFQFIFMTNTDVTGTDIKTLPWKQLDRLKFLNTSADGSLHKLPDNYECDDNFSAQFFILANQAGCLENEIDDLLKNELENLLRNKFDKSVIVVDKFVQFIEDWFNEPKPLDKAAIENTISKYTLATFSYIPDPHLDQPLLTEDSWDIWTQITEKFQVILIAETDQYCQQFFLENNSFSFITSDEKLDKVILNSLKLSSANKIVLMKPRNCIEKCTELLKEHEIIFFYNLDTISSGSLRSLQNLPFYLQGRIGTINELLNLSQTTKLYLTTNSILKLLRKQLAIGDHFEQLPDNHTKRLLPQVLVKSSIFQLKESTFIIIDPDSRFSEYALEENITTANHISVIKDYNELDLVVNYNVHILKLHVYIYSSRNFILEWLYSYNPNVEELSAYIDTILEKFDIDSLYSTVNRVEHLTLPFLKKVLIVAGPGMGKTIFLHHLWSAYPTDFWVIHITMNNINYDKVARFAKYLDLYKSALKHGDAKWFDMFYDRQKIVVLCDGFDEIAPLYEDKASQFIHEIVRSNLRIVVTSREVTGQKLVKLLNVLPITLLPFGKYKQTKFLRKYYDKLCYATHVDDQKSAMHNEFATKLLDKSNFSKWDADFSGVPLQCKMLGEAFVDNCVTHCTTKLIHLPNNFNLLDLYENFVSKKFKIYFEEKAKNDPVTAANAKIMRMLQKEFKENHILAALDLIFPMLDLRPTEDFLEEVLSGDEKSGLIVGLDNNQKPIFTHRTFAEYFSGLWIADNFKSKNSAYDSNVIRLLMLPQYNVVQDVFDRIVCKNCKLHTAVLNNDVEEVRKMFKQIVDPKTDVCKRATVQLVTARGSIHEKQYYSVITREDKIELYGEMLNFLLENLAWQDLPDDMISFKPQQFAEERKAAGMLDVLFKHNVIKESSFLDMWTTELLMQMCTRYDYLHLAKALIDYNRLNAESLALFVYHIDEKKSFVCGRNLLHLSSFYGNKNMTELYLNYFDINVTNERYQTPLHFACHGFKFEMVKFLVERGAYSSPEDKYGFVPVDSAIKGSGNDIKDFLTSFAILKTAFNDDVNKVLSKKLGLCALHYASASGNKNSVIQLLAEGANIDAKTNSSWTALHYAAKNEAFEVVKILIEAGANPNIRTKDFSYNGEEINDTVLKLSREYDFREIFMYLYDFVTDKDGEDIQYFTTCRS